MSHFTAPRRSRARREGFTLIEVMMVVAIIGILAATAAPELVKYIRKSRTVEAIGALDRMAAGAVVYYARTHDLPISTAGFVPTQTFADACANFAGIVQPAPGEWNLEPWLSLSFQLVENPRYRYRFHNVAGATPAEANAYAQGDLDCDGIFSLWRTQLIGNAEGGIDRRGPFIFMGDDTE